MASEEVSKTEAVIDSAVGPCLVTTRLVEGFDVDDFVRTTIENQAIHLQMRQLVLTVDTRFTANRPPVDVGDAAVGGFDNG